MSNRLDPVVGRRTIVRAIGCAATAVAACAVPHASAIADTETDREKHKALYQADSPEVQTFYRVNRYPTR
jgi:hypothetical protein